MNGGNRRDGAGTEGEDCANMGSKYVVEKGKNEVKIRE